MSLLQARMAHAERVMTLGNTTTSTGVLERPYCQMEIRHALALKKPVVLIHGE